jgi:hypothetical protein
MTDPQSGSGQQAGSGQQSSQQTVKAITDLTSNLATLLNAAGVQNTKAIQLLQQTVIGVVTVAAAASVTVVGAVVAGVAAVIGIIATALTKQGPNEIEQISALLKPLFQGDAATAINQRLSTIQIQVGRAQTIADQLTSLQNNPPVGADAIRQTLEPILNAINGVSPPADPSQPDGLWALPLAYTVSWDDSDSPDVNNIDSGVIMNPSFWGHGKQAPPADANNNVFNYTSVLPAYLYAVSIFLSTGALIDPNFQQNYSGSVLKSTADLLQSVHDYIVNQGLKQLVPPQPVTTQSLSGWVTAILPGAGMPPGLMSLLGTGFLEPAPIGVRIEYGWVETFSGYSSVGLYYVLSPYSPNFSYQGKFEIRLLRRYKDVYVGAGLLSLWEAINNLLQLSGKAPVASPSLADWSFRRDIVSKTGGQQLDGSISLQAVMAFFLNTPPGDVPQSLWPSFRNVLSV